MNIQILLVAHIVVLGYWLGAELVINSTYRYVCFNSEMPFADRDALMSHVKNVDQHVRYALVLQAGFGAALAFLLGYFPGGESAAVVAGLVAAVWLVFVEVVHRRRLSALGSRLALLDRGTRYGLMTLLVAIWGAAMAGYFTLEPWLAWKLLCFAAIMGCGVGIRLQGIRMFQVWPKFQQGSTPALERAVRTVCIRASSILGVLWLFIGVIVLLSLWKPG